MAWKGPFGGDGRLHSSAGELGRRGPRGLELAAKREEARPQGAGAGAATTRAIAFLGTGLTGSRSLGQGPGGPTPSPRPKAPRRFLLGGRGSRATAVVSPRNWGATRGRTKGAPGLPEGLTAGPSYGCSSCQAANPATLPQLGSRRGGTRLGNLGGRPVRGTREARGGFFQTPARTGRAGSSARKKRRKARRANPTPSAMAMAPRTWADSAPQGPHLGGGTPRSEGGDRGAQPLSG